MTEKYYVSELSDLYIGYECEIYDQSTTKLIKKVEWHPIKVGLGNETGEIVSINKCKKLIKNKFIRTSYLTLEQIEDEGWIKQNNVIEGKQRIYHIPDYELKTAFGSLRLYINYLDNPGEKIVIEKYISRNGMWELSSKEIVYSGKIPSINEFRKIISLLKLT